jgi:diguanylate cyclase (GGDEF)-like protein/PAS domain S-box-containing protein
VRKMRLAVVCAWLAVVGVAVQLAFGSAVVGRVFGGLGLLAALLTVREVAILLTDRRDALAALSASEQRFRSLVLSSSDVIIVLDEDNMISYVSPSVERVLGHEAQRLVGERWDDLVNPADSTALDAIWDALRKQPDTECATEVQLMHGDGEYRWHELMARNLLSDPVIRGTVLTHRDITDRRAYHELLVYDAAHDMLTGLANRAELTRRLIAACAESRQAGVPAAVLLLDLDGFQAINEELGHAAGDDVLVAVARVLTDSILGSDVVGRLGGDEFAAVLRPIHNEADAMAVANRILTAVRQPIRTKGEVVHTAASIGIALSTPDQPDAAELLRRADLAMYQAKRRGKDCAYVYDPSAYVSG